MAVLTSFFRFYKLKFPSYGPKDLCDPKRRPDSIEKSSELPGEYYLDMPATFVIILIF